MFLLEPQRTPFDLNFRLGDIPVRIHPFFWIVSLIMFGSGASLQGPHAPMLLAIWIGVSFVSILIHELGHAFVMKYYGDRPSVVLYAFGGLAIPSGGGHGDFYDSGWRPRARLTPARQIIISAAGPVAGFLLAAATIVVARVGGIGVTFGVFEYLPYIEVVGAEDNIGLHYLLQSMIWINVFWGLFNLLPVYPLDGGQIARELFTLSGTYDGIRKSLYLSMFTAVGAAVLGFMTFHSLYIALLFGSLAYSSWQAIQQISRY